MTEKQLGLNQTRGLRPVTDQRIFEPDASVVSGGSERDSSSLLHEIQVRLRDLEQQNEVLRRTVQATQSLGARFQDLYDLAPVGYILVDVDGVVVEANRKGAAFLRVNASELIGRPIDSFMTLRSSSEFASFLGSLLESEATEAVELEFVISGATVWNALVRGNVVRSQDGVASAFRIVLEDLDRWGQNDETTEQFRLALNHADIMLSNQDTDLRYTWTYNLPSQYEGQPLLGSTDDEILGAEAARELVELKRRVLRTAKGVRTEICLELRNGSRSYDLILEPLLDSCGAAIGIRSASLDTTDRRKAEQEKRSLEHRHTRIYDSMIVSIGQLTPDGTVIDVNQTALDATGLRRDEIIGRPIWSAYGLAYSQDFQEHLKSLVVRAGQGETVREDLLFRVAKDVFIAVDTIIAPIYDDLGRLTSVIASGVDITDRKIAEQRLEKSESLFRALAEASPIGIFHNEISGQCTYANSRMFEIAGFDAETIVASGWKAIIHPDDWDRVADEWVEATREGRTFKSEYRFKWPDGTVVWVAGRASPQIAPGGEMIGYVGTVNDITERWHMNQALLRSENEFNEAQRIAKIGSWSLDIANDLLTWSAEVFRILEIDPNTNDASLELFYRFVHEMDCDAVVAAYDHSVEHHVPFEFVHRIIMPDGRIKYVHERCETEYDSAGCAVRSIGTVQDITQRKEAEALLRDSEAHLSAIINAIPDHLTRVRSDGTFLDYRASEVLPQLMDREGMIGRKLQDIYPPEIWKPTMAAVSEALETYRTVPFEVEFEVKGVVHLFECRTVKITENEVLIIGREITETRKNKEELRRSTEQLHFLSQQLMKAQEDERRRIGHELHDEIGQLLTGLILSFNAFSRDVPEHLQEALRLPTSLIRDIIKRHRLLVHSMNPRTLDTLGLGPVLKQHFRRFSDQTGIKVHATMKGLARLGPCTSDVRISAYRIVQEALTNVARHANVKEVRVEAVLDDSKLNLLVHDMGCGFSSAAISESYQTIGLIGMRERAIAVGGTCEITSEQGNGTLIRAVLPCCPNKATKRLKCQPRRKES